MTDDLKVLADHRNELLLAEVAAWLHDMGKCADEHIINQASDRPSGYSYSYKTAFSSLIASAQVLNLLGDSIALRRLVEQARPKLVPDANHPWLLRTLGRCHAAAHIEKEDTDTSGKQPASDTRLSTAFGFEQAPVTGLTTRVQRLPYARLADRPVFWPAVKKEFGYALGETRRPENEVTLWDWSSLVAALYKAAVAGGLLGHKPEPTDVRWRLLSVRVNSATLLDHVTRMPDLLARQQLIQDGFEKVRILLEETYPLGTEVYRDENSSLYVVPDLSTLMTLTDQNGACVEALIKQAFSHGTVNDNPALAISGEAVPQVALDPVAWWGQRPDRTDSPTRDEVPPISRVLQRPVEAAADAGMVDKWWLNARRDICPVCGLRPQASPSSKAGRRNVCDVCERRRDDRAKAWVAQLGTSTIWLDEVADLFGRTVLLVGQFDLDQWLMGRMVETLTVRDPFHPAGGVPSTTIKNPSFARMRRVWETTYWFWQGVLPTNPDADLLRSLVVQIVGQTGARLVISGSLQPAGAQDTLGPFHAYELVLADGVRLGVVWDANRQRFVTADNLSYIAGLLGEELPAREKDEPYSDYWLRVSSWGTRSVQSHLVNTLTIEEPRGYGSENVIRGEIVVTADDIQVARTEEGTTTYSPIIPILAEPRTFMALIPANRALAVVQAIKEKYERELGKVGNRLPLTLGLVYADRRTPLASVLDAGRRMLRHQSRTLQASVEAVSSVDPWPQAVTLSLKIGERTIPVRVPTVMGDGTTADVWYPYWQVVGKPMDRKRWFVGPDGEHWVHATDLRQGDLVAFTPSSMDFEYLDASARRFEVAYGGDGQRLGQDKRQRPYLLEQVADLQAAWQQISPSSTSQIKALEALIETKRRDWNEPTGTLAVSGAFRQFVADAVNQLVAGALRDAEADTTVLEEAAVTGMLADVLEIYLTIHKDKPQQENA